MTSSTPSELPRMLYPGLVLRHAVSCEDIERVVQCDEACFGVGEGPGIREHYCHRPGQTPEDVFMVQDTATGEVASTVSLAMQSWTYEGIPFPVAEVGVVSTREAYRKKGLVRAQFHEYHRLARERGGLVSIIAGILYFYRQFGYDYILAMGGGRTLKPEQIPDREPGASSPYTLRKATMDADLPTLLRLYAVAVKDLMLAAVVTDELWRYQETQPNDSHEAKDSYLVERGGEVIGYFRMARGEGDDMSKGAKIVEAYLPDEEACLLALRHAKRIALEERQEKIVKLEIPLDIPLIRLGEKLGGEWQRPYAWQVRVLDPVGFIQVIAPVLERRLAASQFAGLTKEFVLRLHTQEPVVINFQEGRVVNVSHKPSSDAWDLQFAPTIAGMFLLGYRSVDELLLWYPDAIRRDEPARLLANVLFPKKASWTRSLF